MMNIELGKIQFHVNKDLRGNLVVAEYMPFEIKRVFWFYMMMGRPRGGHTTKKTHQIITVLGGQIEVVTTYEHDMKKWYLRDNEYRGLLMPAMTWRDLRCKSRNAICLVLASEPYDEEDYIRDWEEWNALREPRQTIPSVQT